MPPGKPSRKPGIGKKKPESLVKRGVERKNLEGRSFRGQAAFIKQGERNAYMILQSPEEWAEYKIHVFRAEGVWHFVPCIPNCPLDREDDPKVAKTSNRFAVNVLNMRENIVQVLEGPKDLFLRILDEYDAKPESFLKRVYDISKYNTTPVTYGVRRAEEAPKSTKGLEMIDLDEWVEAQIKRYYGDDLDIEEESESDTLDDPEEEPEEEPAPRKKPAAKKNPAPKVEEPDEEEDEDELDFEDDDPDEDEDLEDEDEDEEFEALDELEEEEDEDEEAEEPPSNVRKLPGRKAPAKKPGKKPAPKPGRAARR